MDVHFKCIAFPAAQFADGEVWFSVEVESHGTPGSEGVAADIGVFVAAVANEAMVASGLLDGGIDEVRVDFLPCYAHGVGIGIDAYRLVVVAILHNVMDPSGE